MPNSQTNSNNIDLWYSNRKHERFEEEEIFKLNKQEVRKCRYRIIDHSTGDAECYIHDGNHGVRLFPKHLWNIVDGIVYYKNGDKWIRWFPDLKANLSRFEEWEK